MPYINEEGGRLNNYAIEPKVYKAEPPTSQEQRNYLILGVGAVILVGSMLFVAVSASNLG